MTDRPANKQTNKLGKHEVQNGDRCDFRGLGKKLGNSAWGKVRKPTGDEGEKMKRVPTRVFWQSLGGKYQAS